MLITKEVEVNIRTDNAEYYRCLGYTIPSPRYIDGKMRYKITDTIIIDIKDLPHMSEKKVEYRCDSCNRVLITSYSSYNKTKKDDGKTYCQKCGLHKEFYSVGQWMIDNNISLDYWSEKNNITPFDVGYGSIKKVWFKCLCTDYHNDFLRSPNIFVKSQGCPYCAKKKNVKVHERDSLGYLCPDSLDFWSDKNVKSIWCIKFYRYC